MGGGGLANGGGGGGSAQICQNLADVSSIVKSVSYEEFRKSGKKLEQLGKSALYENI